MQKIDEFLRHSHKKMLLSIFKQFSPHLTQQLCSIAEFSRVMSACWSVNHESKEVPRVKCELDKRIQVGHITFNHGKLKGDNDRW